MAKVMSIQRTDEKADRTVDKADGPGKGQGGSRTASVSTNGKMIALLLTIVVAVLWLGVMMSRTHAIGSNEDVSKMPPKMGMPTTPSKP